MRWRARAAAAWILVAGSCHRAPAPEFRIASTSPLLGEAAAPLLLNDSITVQFADALLGSSITADSVFVLNRQGERVRGQLRVGSHWVAFVPEPPLSPGLDDGSLRLGESYELHIAGMPRPDAVRALDGRRLAEMTRLAFRVIGREELPAGFAAPLRPSGDAMPFLLRASDGPGSVPADHLVVTLRFSAPLLPGSVQPAAFDVRALSRLSAAIPVRVAAVTAPGDLLPGSSVELEFSPQNGEPVMPGDWLSVALTSGADALRDYRGDRVLPSPAQFWNVIAGRALTLLSLPGEQQVFAATEPLGAGFEVRLGRIQPRVRAEAGDGHLGLFQPSQDQVLTAGRYEFAAVDIPRGVTVTLDQSLGPVQWLVTGAVRVRGNLVVVGGSAAFDERQLTPLPMQDWLDLRTAMVLAAGDLAVEGEIRTAAPAAPGTTSLVLASGGQLQLGGELPYRTVLVMDAQASTATSARIVGPRGQAILRTAQFGATTTVAAGVAGDAVTNWVRVPDNQTLGEFAMEDASPGFAVAWQQAPPHAVALGTPDESPLRVTPFQRVRDRERVALTPGHFVRLRLSAEAGTEGLPSARAVRLLLR